MLPPERRAEAGIRSVLGPNAERPFDEPLRGVVLTVIGVLLLVGISACFKYLSPLYPPLEIVWARYFFSLLAIMLLFPRRVPKLFVAHHLLK